MMAEMDIEKICKALAEKLRKPETPPKPTGMIEINVQTGCVKDDAVKLKLVL